MISMLVRRVSVVVPQSCFELLFTRERFSFFVKILELYLYTLCTYANSI